MILPIYKKFKYYKTFTKSFPHLRFLIYGCWNKICSKWNIFCSKL